MVHHDSVHQLHPVQISQARSKNTTLPDVATLKSIWTYLARKTLDQVQGPPKNAKFSKTSLILRYLVPIGSQKGVLDGTISA